MKVKMVKFHQAVNFPLGGVTNVNESDKGIKQIDTCPEGVIVTTESNARYLIPFANIPFLLLQEDETPQPVETPKKKR